MVWLSADGPHQHRQTENDERETEYAACSNEHVGLHAIKKR
jgi:hypothetical protein